MRGSALVNYPAGPALRLITTRGNDAAARFPELAGLPAALAPHVVVLDGEVVAFDGPRPSFGRLQRRMHLSRPAAIARAVGEVPVVYVVFDLLHLDGRDLRPLPYLERRRLLAETISDGPAWRVPDHHVAGGEALLAAARDLQLEGIVAKRANSPYVAGRSKSWVKVKIRPRQEFVVGGWRPGDGGRSGRLGALLVGYYDPSGRLRYAGRVGTGFSQADLQLLGRLLEDHASDQCPFSPSPPAGVAKAARWVRPELVAEVAYGEWTTDGSLRHPSYLGLRTDRDPLDVVREA